MGFGKHSRLVSKSSLINVDGFNKLYGIYMYWGWKSGAPTCLGLDWAVHYFWRISWRSDPFTKVTPLFWLGPWLSLVQFGSLRSIFHRTKQSCLVLIKPTNDSHKPPSQAQSQNIGRISSFWRRVRSCRELFRCLERVTKLKWPTVLWGTEKTHCAGDNDGRIQTLSCNIKVLREISPGGAAAPMRASLSVSNIRALSEHPKHKH